MKTDLTMESALRETLHDCADGLQAPAQIKSRVDFAVNTAPQARVRTRGRTAIIAAAMMGVLAVTAYAVTSAILIVGHSDNRQNLDHAEALAHVQQIDSDAALPEQFDNGFVYQKAADINNMATDTSGKEVAFLSLNAEYMKDGKNVALYVSPADIGMDVPNAEVQPGETKVVGDDIKMEYYQTEYKAVPPSYRPTEEEQARIDAGELTIGYGADEIKILQYENVMMTVGDVRYELLANDQALGADEMFAMLTELAE